MSNPALYEKILSNLVYAKDDRKPPDNQRRAQFKMGWKNASLWQKPYTEKKLDAVLTWNNLGYRFGIELGHCSESEMDEAYDFLAQQYAVEGSKSSESVTES